MDDEIGGALDAIRDKGAFVWAVFDCCHSGTATRAAESRDERSARSRPSDLGIPEARDARRRRQRSRSVDDDGERMPAFKPDRADRRRADHQGQAWSPSTPRRPSRRRRKCRCPRATADAERFGLFTFTIFSKLAENPNVTYRQLGQAVLQQYSADSRTRPTPLFEGELDARVFGTEKTDAIMQWPIVVKDDAATIGAGLLHRLTPGTKLAILPSPLSRAVRCARLSRGAVGEEPGEPGEAGRVRRQAGAEARRHSGQRLCAASPSSPSTSSSRWRGPSTPTASTPRSRWSIRCSTSWSTSPDKHFNVALVDAGPERRHQAGRAARERHRRRGRRRHRPAGAVVPAGVGRRDAAATAASRRWSSSTRTIAPSWPRRPTTI